MTISLCIIGWLLSGFLAAWASHYIEEQKVSMSIREVFWLSVAGGAFVLMLCVYTLFFSDLLSKPFFKAKEPK